VIETTIIPTGWNQRNNTVGRDVILMTSLHPVMIPIHVVATGIAVGDPITVEAVGNQITKVIGAVELGSAVETAAEASRPKIVISAEPKATAEAVVAKIATVAVAAVAAKARSTNAIDLLDNLVKKPKRLIVREDKPNELRRRSTPACFEPR